MHSLLAWLFILFSVFFFIGGGLYIGEVIAEVFEKKFGRDMSPMDASMIVISLYGLIIFLMLYDVGVVHLLMGKIK